VLTNDPAHAARAGDELRAGIVWINEWQGAVKGAQAEPQRLSGRGIGFGPGLWNELRTTRYVHRGSASPEDDAQQQEDATKQTTATDSPVA
jgi:acyl-CoA reductase-like NAD-dependent aldehyde dehydrogenase